mmetsp:Transcript_19762/g.75773  ORF Transcript_19762/g.75773 Transcript_19762/m.75773 type:complete len:717 (+) Transcript_19762:105-2255(+)
MKVRSGMRFMISMSFLLSAGWEESSSASMVSSPGLAPLREGWRFFLACCSIFSLMEAMLAISLSIEDTDVLSKPRRKLSKSEVLDEAVVEVCLAGAISPNTERSKSVSCCGAAGVVSAGSSGMVMGSREMLGSPGSSEVATRTGGSSPRMGDSGTASLPASWMPTAVGRTWPGALGWSGLWWEAFASGMYMTCAKRCFIACLSVHWSWIACCTMMSPHVRQMWLVANVSDLHRLHLPAPSGPVVNRVRRLGGGAQSVPVACLPMSKMLSSVVATCRRKEISSISTRLTLEAPAKRLVPVGATVAAVEVAGNAPHSSAAVPSAAGASKAANPSAATSAGSPKLPKPSSAAAPAPELPKEPKASAAGAAGASNAPKSPKSPASVSPSAQAAGEKSPKSAPNPSASGTAIASVPNSPKASAAAGASAAADVVAFSPSVPEPKSPQSPAGATAEAEASGESKELSASAGAAAVAPKSPKESEENAAKSSPPTAVAVAAVSPPELPNEPKASLATVATVSVADSVVVPVPSGAVPEREPKSSPARASPPDTEGEPKAAKSSAVSPAGALAPKSPNSASDGDPPGAAAEAEPKSAPNSIPALSPAPEPKSTPKSAPDISPPLSFGPLPASAFDSPSPSATAAPPAEGSAESPIFCAQSMSRPLAARSSAESARAPAAAAPSRSTSGTDAKSKSAPSVLAAKSAKSPNSPGEAPAPSAAPQLR